MVGEASVVSALVIPFVMLLLTKYFFFDSGKLRVYSGTVIFTLVAQLMKVSIGKVTYQLHQK